MSRRAAAALIALDVGALGGLRPDLGQLRRAVTAPQAWVDTVGIDGAAEVLILAAIWLAAAWIALGALAAAAGTAPGAVGRLGAGFARVVLPVVVQRLLVGGLGLGVLLAPVTADAATAGTGGPAMAGFPAGAGVLPGPSWPTTPTAPDRPTGTAPAPASPTGSPPTTAPTTTPPTPTAPPSTAPPSTTPPSTTPPSNTAPLPAPRWPVAPAPDGAASTSDPTTPAPHPSTRTRTPSNPAPTADPSTLPGPAWPGSSTPAPSPSPSTSTPRPPAPRQPDPPAPPNPAPRHTPTTGRTDVRVRAGDSLWLLAAHRLHDAHPTKTEPTDTAVAAYWPRVYAANRTVIGDDPALITPGQVLHLPAPDPAENHQEQS